MKRLIVILLSCLTFLNGSGNVLYWQVTEDATVDRGNIKDFVESFGTYEGELPNGDTYISYNVAARVKVTGGNLSQPEYLRIYFGDGEFEDGSLGLDLAPDTGGYWGLGVSSPVQSSVEEYGYGSELFKEYAFMVELGELTWDDVAKDLNWTTIAQSDEFAAEMLSQYIHERFELAPPSLAAWNPNFHTVPEPSTSLLCLLGSSLLILRRKNT